MLRLGSVSGGGRLGGVVERTVIIQDSDVAHGAVQWRSGPHSINTVSCNILYCIATHWCLT